MSIRSKPPSRKPSQDPPNPAPLPSPEYGVVSSQGEPRSNSGDFDVLTDEILLIRTRLGVLFQAGRQPGLPPSRLAPMVELFSRAAARLARLLYCRQEIYHLHIGDSQRLAERYVEDLGAARELEGLVDIRSSKNSSLNLLIENPLTLSPLARELLKPFLYSGEKSASHLGIRGRPGSDLFAVLEGVLHKLLTGTPWYHLPLNYPPSSTCHRYYTVWRRSGLLEKLLFFLSLALFSEEISEQEQQEQVFGDFIRALQSSERSDARVVYPACPDAVGNTSVSGHEIEETGHVSENGSAPSYMSTWPLEKDLK